jgi:hypothetical protein
VIDPPGSKLSSAWTICSLWSPVVVHGSTKPELAMILGAQAASLLLFGSLPKSSSRIRVATCFLSCKLPTTAGQLFALPGLQRLRDHSIN